MQVGMAGSAAAAAAAAASSAPIAAPSIGVRETGVVMAVKDAYGFIRCAQREDKVFFHFSELLNASNEHEIERGDEVAFNVVYEADSGRFSGVNVELLPPGSVVFEEIGEVICEGVVERELQGQQRVFGRRTARLQQEPFGGRICAPVHAVPGLRQSDVLQLAGGGADVLLEFSGRDVDDPRVALQQGDVVTFRLFTELRSGRQGATAVALKTPAGNRETGQVVSIRENYGFLRCADRECKQMFFHFSELLNADAVVGIGTELEFEVALNKKGQLHATRVVVLPAGSLVFSVVDPQEVSGVISQPIKHIRTPSGKTRRTSRPNSRDVGFVKVTMDADDSNTSPALRNLSPEASPEATDTSVDADSTAAAAAAAATTTATPDESAELPIPRHEKTLSFSGADLKHPRIELVQGDRVAFKVSRDTRTRALSATEVVLVQPCANGRERGIVSMLKAQYGFIRCEKRSDPLFFHFNEFVDAEFSPQLGDEIEFNVHPDNRGQDNATRITALPQGSVVFEFLELGGTVVAAAGAASNPEAAELVAGSGSAGAVCLSNESVKQLEAQVTAGALLRGESTSVTPSLLGYQHMYPFGLVDLLTPKTALRLDDEVSFVFRVNPSGPSNRVSALRMQPKHGTVESVAVGGGLIRLHCSSGEMVGFSAKDVAGAVLLRVGDEVVIQTLTFNAHANQRTARLVERTKQGSPDVADAFTKRNGDAAGVSPAAQKRANAGNRVRQMNRMARGPDGSRGFAAGTRRENRRA